MKKTNKLLCSFSLIILIFSGTVFAKSKIHIAILATGGGIAGIAKTNTGQLYSPPTIKVDALLQQIPQIQKKCTILAEQVVQIPSQEMTNDIWLKLAKRVNKLLSSKIINGLVITHGTDTLEETAYFLNLVVNSKKPVVLVGAARANNHLSPDGPSNLYDAISIAASKQARGKGVLITMNGKIFSSRGCTKVLSFGPDAIESKNTGFLGFVNDGTPVFYQASTRKHTYKTQFDLKDIDELPKVDIVYGYANAGREAIDAFAHAASRGIVLAGVGNGNIRTNALKGLIDASNNGIVVVRSSRVPHGQVTRESEVEDEKYGFVAADNLSPQKARVLLMLALTETKDSHKIQKIFYQY